MVTYQYLAMPLKGIYMPADRPRDELEGEEEEETVQTLLYSQVHQSGTARPNGEDADDGEFGSAFYIPEERHAEVLEAS